jgi:hypothetical protein
MPTASQNFSVQYEEQRLQQLCKLSAPKSTGRTERARLMSYEIQTSSENRINHQPAEQASLSISNHDMSTFQSPRFADAKGISVIEREQALFGPGFSFSLAGDDIYSNDKIEIAQVHRLDDQPLSSALEKLQAPERGTKPFIDTGKMLEADNPNSWTLPTPDNYKGWIPGDIPNPFTWATDSSLYIQEIMKQNFVTNAEGKRVSIFDLDKRYDHFKKQFGNAARHALGMGSLMFVHGASPEISESLMYSHEPLGWAGGAMRSAREGSMQAYRAEMKDSDADIKNNAYAARQSAHFHDFNSFAHQMLVDCWKSATNGSDVIEAGHK